MKQKRFSFIFIFVLLLFFIPVGFAYANTDQLIIINKAKNQLAFYDKGKLEKTFSVATGKTRLLTPEGQFRVIVKAKNVPYYKLGIPGGAPNNPLGPRWIGINVPGTNGYEYGIHGNSNPASIGKYVSAGCVRMHNNEVVWLYDRVKYNTRVIITHSDKLSFDQIAKKYGYKLVEPEIEASVQINGVKKSFPQKPLLTSGRVIVPMRTIFQELGAKVTWDQKKQQVTAVKGDTTLVLTIGSKKATINGKTVTFDTPPQLKGYHTYVPIRFVSEALNAQVGWNSKQRLVSINVPEEPPVIEPPIEEPPVEEELEDVIPNEDEENVDENDSTENEGI